MGAQPAPNGAAFAILFLVTVLRHDEFRFQRHRAVMPGRHYGCGQHCMEILDFVLPAFAMRAVRAMGLPRAMVLGAVQAAGLAQFGDDIGENRVEMRWFDRIEHGADPNVAGNFVHSEQRVAVGTALGCFQMALMGQERRALHEEGCERGEREVGHGIGCVLPDPWIRQQAATAA